MFSRKGTYPAIDPSPRRRLVHLQTDWRRVACRQGEVKGDLYATRSPLEVTCPRCKKAASHETFTSVYSDKPGRASGRTTHLVPSKNAKYALCGEKAYADTGVASVKDTTCYYCKQAWEKAHDAKVRAGRASGISYQMNDPRGWGGDPKRGAALGRPSIRGEATFAGRLTLRRVRLDQGGYDSNGTYFGLGAPLYWYASDDGSIDDMLRAGTRESAKKQILDRYPNARFYR